MNRKYSLSISRAFQKWLPGALGFAILTIALSAQDISVPFIPPAAVQTSRPGKKSPWAIPAEESRQAVAFREIPDNPSVSDITSFTGFPEPLKPVGDAEGDASTADLGSVINRWATRKVADDFSLLEGFVENHASSAWAPAIRYNLGKLYYSTGYFSRAIDAYESAGTALNGVKDEWGVKLRSLAVAELAGMYARTGRKEELEKLLAREKETLFADGAGVQMGRALEGLSLMNTQPEISFRCGTYALSNVARKLGWEIPSDFLDANPSPPQGFALSQLQKIAADQLKQSLRAVKREGEGKIPVPSVIHLRCGHYAALLAEQDGQFLLSDPTFGRDVWITRKAVAEEGSGFYLVSESTVKQDLEEVSQDRAAGIFGKGNVTACDPRATTQCEKATSSCPGPPPPGMAAYRFYLMTANLSVSDMPLVIPTGFGPALSLSVTYNQYESNQSSTRQYSNFGPLWVCNMVSWLEDNTTNDSSGITLYLPGGGSEFHENYTSIATGQGYYGIQRESRTRLYRKGPGQYERVAMDGSKLIYQRAIGTTGNERKVFLSKIVDSWGNVMNLSYDSTYEARLSSVTAASGQALHFFYTNSSDPYLVTAAADDSSLAATGRKAAFGYDPSTRRLASITDPVGIVSAFGYLSSGFMKTLTTPYGITSFKAGGAEAGGLLRWLEAKDPQGDTERVEFRNLTDENTISASPLPSATGVSANTDLRKYRNSFYWSKKAWASGPGDRSKAHLYHWLHTPGGEAAYGTLEMEKPAFENNIWYNYAGQLSSFYPDVSFPPKPSVPAAVSRAIEGPDGITVTAIERYEYHANSGNPTKYTDAQGRVIRLNYDTSGYDPLSMEIKNGATWDVIQSFGNYTKHKPGTITDKQGKTTLITYTDEGQIKTLTNSLSETTTYNYESVPGADGFGMLKSVTGPVVGSGGSVSYDTSDRIYSVTDSSNRTIIYGYDALDRLTLITYPDGSLGMPTTRQLVYDRLDLFARKDREGRWTRTWHNSLRQPVLEMDSMGQMIQLQWCKCGAMSKIVDAKGQVTFWKHDAQARVIEKNYADGRKESVVYEALSGRLKSRVDGMGQTKNFVYNLDGSVKSYTYANAVVPTPGVSFTYDPIYRRLSTMTDVTGLTSYVYYPVGSPSSPVLGALMLKTVDGPLSGSSDLITYTYDSLGRGKTSNIGPVGTENSVNINYDSLGRMTSVVNNLGSFGYFYEGTSDRLDYVNLANGQRTDFDYFPASGDNRLKAIHHFVSSSPTADTISKFDYSYSPDGMISSWQRQAGSAPATQLTPGYDLANQLTSVDVAPVADLDSITQRYSYQYDKLGNRISEQVNNLITSATYNNINQVTNRAGGGKLLVAGITDEPAKVKVNSKIAKVTSPQNLFQAWIDVTPGINTINVEAADCAIPPNSTTKAWHVAVTGGSARSFNYDKNGNTLEDGLRGYQWDAANRLVKITKGAMVYEFIYDGLSRRVAEVVNGTPVCYWLWDGARIAEERNATGTAIKKRYYSQGEQRVGGSDAGSYYYTRDHLGSIREMTDSAVTVRVRYDYDPYGRRSKISGDLDCDFGFTGYYYHAGSDLCLSIFRAYDQDSGRWLSQDPIKEKGGINLYSYCYGNPLNFYDPNGMSPEGTEEGRNYDQDNVSSFVEHDWSEMMAAFNDAIDLIGGMFEAPTINGQIVLTGTVCLNPASLIRTEEASSATAAQAYKNSLRAAMAKPFASNPKLVQLLNELYRDGASIGSGSTAAAVRHELATGEMVGGRTHSIKAKNYIDALAKWLKDNPKASSCDRAAAENVMQDMINALNGK